MLIPKGKSYCRRKSSGRGPRFKVLSEGLSTELDILIRSPIKVLIEADVAYITRLYQAVDCSSEANTIDTFMYQLDAQVCNVVCI